MPVAMPKADLEDMVAMEVDDAANEDNETPPVQVQLQRGTETEESNANLGNVPDDPDGVLASVATSKTDTDLDEEQVNKARDSELAAREAAVVEARAVASGAKRARSAAHKRAAKRNGADPRPTQ